MPMSRGFQNRLFHRLPEITEIFGTPFHIFDEKGIIDTGEKLKSQFSHIHGFREFFAVKALPNPAILKIIKGLGFGVDCSSPSELMLARRLDYHGESIMFSSNNTTLDTFKAALTDGGCILNIDDISMIDMIPDFPRLACFRFNPGEKRTGNQIIGIPVEAKYGLRHDQIVGAYKKAVQRGAKRFGLHTMIVSNERNYHNMVDTVKMLLDVMGMVTVALRIKFDFMNIGGGVGIPYRPDDRPFDMPALVAETEELINDFRLKLGYLPSLFMECGRLITGPHGVLVARVINQMSKYREYIGVDASTMSANPRPAIYESAYHHITIVDPKGRPRQGGESVVDVVGPLCENNDKFAKQRLLPKAHIGDIMVQHDTGAHSPAMESNYNGWLRPQELLLREDGKVELIRRAETYEDLFATLNFKPKVIKTRK
jgi:diaminopimelate decarboxylase